MGNIWEGFLKAVAHFSKTAPEKPGKIEKPYSPNKPESE